MSRANASARQRRAGVIETPPPPSLSTPTAQSAVGLTLPQVISLVDTRLIKLEQFMKETLENNNSTAIDSTIASSSNNDASDPNQLTDLNEILEEYNNRFVLLAEEIGQLKDIVLKLQTYTMDVNKMLLEERTTSIDIENNNNNDDENTITLK